MQEKGYKCSIIIPIHNEKDTILEVINNVQTININKEIIIVDDYSTDGTREILQNLKDVKIFYNDKNKGKGAAIRAGFEYATGDIFIIQDGDLEYNPMEIPKLLKPIIMNRTCVVYGSRFKGKGNFLFMSYIANKFLTSLTNLLYKGRLTDMETCYKCIKREVVNTFELNAQRFEFEAEITAKILMSGYKICEIPISYFGRRKNKKIGWRDGIQTIFTLIKLKFIK